MEKSLPPIIKAIESIEEKGKEWVTYTVILGVVLIIIFLIGALLTMLAYRYFSQRMLDTDRPQSES